MQVRCPQCHAPVEMASDEKLSDIACPSCGSSFSLLADAETMPYEAGTKTIGHFDLVEKIGVGTFGFVWKARDTELDRTVAIKIPRKGQLDPDETEQFLREARAAAQLRHSGIVSVHEVGRDQDTVFIVSDFVQGTTLADRLTTLRSSFREAAELCAKIADALHHAHEQGVIHRDLKPGNVILDANGEPHIMDFGLARREAGEVTMTVEGRVLGTPAYMSPEQAKGAAHTADRRSDVYSLGVILFEMLTGERPFRGNIRMLVHQVINDEPPSPRRLNGSVPRDLETVCLKCLEKEPGRRYSTARVMAEDLRRFLGSEPIQARPISRLERGWRWCKRNPAVAGLAGLLLLSLLSGTAIASVLAFVAHRTTWAAIAAQKETRVEADRSRRLLYISDMNVARQAWEENNLGRLRELLRRHMPDGSDDVRGFEWYYLWRLWSLADQADSIVQPARARRIAVCQATGRLAVGCGNGVIWLWNLETKQREKILRESGSAVHGSWPSSRYQALPGWETVSVAFSPDGEILAYTAPNNRDVVLHDLENETCQTVQGHAAAVSAVTFASKGHIVATGSMDGVVILQDLRTGTSSELIQRRESVACLAFSNDCSELAIGAGEVIAVVNVDTRTVLRTYEDHAGKIWAVTYSPDGKHFATASADHTIMLFNLENGDRRILRGHSDEVRSVVFSPDGTLLASGSRDDTAAIWDVATGNKIETFKGHSHNVESVAFFRNSNQLQLVTGGSDGLVKCWKVREAAADHLRCAHDIHQLALLPGKQGIAALLAETRQVNLLSQREGSWTSVLHPTRSAYSIAVSAQHFAVGEEKGIRCWRTRDWQEEDWYINSNAAVTALRFSPDGSLLAAGLEDGSLLICHPGSQSPAEQARDHEQFVTCVEFARNGTILASASFDGTVKIWNTTTGKQVNSIKASDEAIIALAFSHDGAILATGGYDNLARLWHGWTQPGSGYSATLQGHSDGIRWMAFTKDDRTLFTGSDDCTLRVWDVRDRQERFVFVGHTSAVRCADFSSDETLLVSGSRDGSIGLWRAATPEEVKAAGEWWKR